MRIALCDDNELQLTIAETVIKDVLEQKCRRAEVRNFNSGAELIQDVRAGGMYDIYILDMLMPGMNGMEVAGTLRLMGDHGHIIFLSSSLEYGVQSYEVNAAYYFLKPIEPAKFGRVLERLLEKIDDTPQYLTVSTAEKVAMNTVLYVTIDNRRPRYQLRDGRVLYGMALRGKFRDEMQPLLSNPMFILCGINYVFNLTGIDTMDKERVLLENGEVIYLSQSASTQLYHAWLDWRKTR